MSAETNRLVIVTPVYEDAEASTQLFRELFAVFDKKAYIVAVDDGSVRQPTDPESNAAAGLEGVVIPHAIYDLEDNVAYIKIGISRDTSEFACDSIKRWWQQYGQYRYPNSTSILILADSGGSNSCRHYIFKEDLQKLVDEIGIEIRVAHYPPYTSKWYPVEHRVFPHITRSLSGVILRSYQFVKELFENTTKKTGAQVRSHIINKIYQSGRKYSDNFKETMRILFDNFLGQWNYKAIPKNI